MSFASAGNFWTGRRRLLAALAGGAQGVVAGCPEWGVEFRFFEGHELGGEGVGVRIDGACMCTVARKGHLPTDW